MPQEQCPGPPAKPGHGFRFATPPLRAFIAVNRKDVLRQARAATQRIQNGQPLSIFDGVPVKDEVDMVPYATTMSVLLSALFLRDPKQAEI